MESVESTQPEQASDTLDGLVEQDSTQQDIGPVATEEPVANDVSSEQPEEVEKQISEEDKYYLNEDGSVNHEKKLERYLKFESKYRDELNQRRELETQLEESSGKSQHYESYFNDEVYGPALNKTIEDLNKATLQKELGIELPEEATNHLVETRNKVENLERQLAERDAAEQNRKDQELAISQLGKISEAAKQYGMEFTDKDRSDFLQESFDSKLPLSTLVQAWKTSPKVEEAVAKYNQKLGRKQERDRQKNNASGSLSSSGSRNPFQGRGRSIHDIASALKKTASSY